MANRQTPSQWTKCQMREIIDRIQNGLYRSAEFYGTGHPLIRMYNLRSDSWLLKLDTLARVEINDEDLESYRLQVDDILINRVNSVELVGKTAWVGEEASGYVFENMLIRLQLKSTVCSLFIAQQMNTGWVRSQLGSLAKRAGGQASLNSHDILSIEIALPPLPEQQKVAQILRTWDEAIATVEQLIAALQRRKKGLMQRLLTGQVRFPEFGDAPWEEVELGDYLTPVLRTEQVEAGKEYRLIGVRWYLAGAHIHDVVPGDKIVTHALSRIEENDILYNKMWVSKAAFAVAKKEHAGAYGSGEYPQFIAGDDIDVRFIEYAFHDPRFLHDAKALCRGTTGRIRLHPDDFLRLRMRWPSKAEQGKIAQVLQIADQEIDCMKQYLDALRSQKKGLMQRLLTGQVRVQV